MEATEDDMIVLVVVDDEKTKDLEKEASESNSESKNEVDNILEIAQKHGEYVEVKLEPEDDNCDYEYLEDETVTKTVIREESTDGMDFCEGDPEYMPEESQSPRRRDKHRFTMLKPWQQRSFVAELRENHEELRDDKELLINTLGRIMSMAKPPPPPQDYFVMEGVMFACIYCGHVSDTLPAAGRHYQEKHGERYLVCFACGVDFRSTTNLYKHEKRCVAPDAEIVLRARAVCLGRKGRGRPFLTNDPYINHGQRHKYPCSLCSAVFITKSNLKSHENLHRGERPYRCHACPCAYASNSALSRHAKKHTGVQYICDHCGRAFNIKAALVAHMDTHNAVRKHPCEECDRRFAQKCALNLHVYRVHRNLPPPCPCQICPKRFQRMSLLKEHMKKQHGMSIMTRKMFFKALPTMTELEVRESKVIRKDEEEDMLSFLPPPVKIKTEPDFERKQDNGNLYTIKKENETNIIYIQNGEVIKMERGDDEVLFEVENIVDGQIFVKALNNSTLKGDFSDLSALVST
ncbi:unnamed protein product [Spodoptera littoralis]|uniref:C2H2-type domain-containing protein n=1 Tax=Spodoptera littoralis TaxID=7109 RepID=A0A9P0MYI2_SPOLI|nr:unnamed protein product [Spodoptera littoralis]CAH1638057.1 unnamed protein product [Spodoptera littoralis]